MADLPAELKSVIERFVPDPKAPPSRMDRLVYGADCARHPLLGCIIGHGNGDLKEQARNFLRSLRSATVHQTVGRAGDLSEAEFLALFRHLEQWHAAGGKIELPPAHVNFEFARHR
jgi:hypothetical protein